MLTTFIFRSVPIIAFFSNVVYPTLWSIYLYSDSKPPCWLLENASWDLSLTEDSPLSWQEIIDFCHPV